MTKAEAVAFLRARGFHAFEREWAMGETIGVASEPNVPDHDITVYARIGYIARQADGWIVEELDAVPSIPSSRERRSLDDARAEAVSLLSQPRRAV